MRSKSFWFIVTLISVAFVVAGAVLIIYYTLQLTFSTSSASSSQSSSTSTSSSTSGSSSTSHHSSSSSGTPQGQLPTDGSTLRVFCEGASSAANSKLSSFGSYLHVEPDATGSLEFQEWVFTLVEQQSEYVATYRIQNSPSANPGW